MNNSKQEYLQYIRQITEKAAEPNYNLLRDLEKEYDFFASNPKLFLGIGILTILLGIFQPYIVMICILPMYILFFVSLMISYLIKSVFNLKEADLEPTLAIRQFWEDYYRQNPNPYYVFKNYWFEQNFQGKGVENEVKAVAGRTNQKYFRFAIPLVYAKLQDMSFFNDSIYFIHLDANHRLRLFSIRF